MKTTTKTAAEVLAKIEARKAARTVKTESQEELAARIEGQKAAREAKRRFWGRSWQQLNPV